MGVSYFAVATSLIGLVGDYLFDDRMLKDRTATDKVAAEISPLYTSGQADKLQPILESHGGDMNGRLMLLDETGKVQLDSFSQLNGSRLELPEVISILSMGKTADYGVHELTGDGQRTWLDYLKPYNPNSEWVSYCSSALTKNGVIYGVLLYSAPVEDMMQRLSSLQSRMILYFLLAAVAAMVIALFFSRVLTKPLATLTRSIQRMGRGDFSVRVPVKGSSEIRRLSETFNTMSEKLEMLDTSRNQFVSNASHELKTPLATMKILLEGIIYQPEMDAELRTEFLTDINREIDRLNSIISDLLTLVSVDSKAMRLKRTTFSLAQVITDTARLLQPVAERNHQELKLVINDKCEMYADCAKLTQVCYNLMENALKYTQEGGSIRVRLIRSGRDAVFTVSDNGPGIPKEDQAHIFDRFYRVDKARSRDTGGTGLGLSIVHQMVLMHGGSISVESEEGAGSTFTVELPIHQG